MSSFTKKTKKSMKGLSFMESKREQKRRIEEVMDSTDEDDPNIEPEKVIPSWILKGAQWALMFGYCLITMYAIAALAFYLAGAMASVFDNDFDEYVDYVLLGVVGTIMIGSIVGCCMTFKFGTVSTNIDRLKVQTSVLSDKVDGFREVQEVLQSEIKVLKKTLRQINTEKNELFKCVDQFDKLGAELEKNADPKTSEFAKQVNKMSDALWREYEYIKLQNEKADLLKLFYDQQGLDGEDGLSPTEFEYLVFNLDDNIKAIFPTFEEFDENGDGVIDIFEFDGMLDKIYKKLFKEKKKNAERKIGDHYINRNKQINASRRRKRRESIQLEKTQKKVKMPLSIFSRLKSVKSFRKS